MGDEEVGNSSAKRRKASVSALEQSGPGRLPCKVLLVDDEPAILSVLQWALQDQGYTVTVAHGGRAGLDALCRGSFDILVTDLIMPDVDGARLLQRAKELDPEMKIVVMTGSPWLVPGLLKAGARMDGLMIKPFGMNTLKHVISACAEGKDGMVASRILH